jgi:hypothetical protein
VVRPSSIARSISDPRKWQGSDAAPNSSHCERINKIARKCTRPAHLIHATGRVWLHQRRYLVPNFVLEDNQTESKDNDMSIVHDGSEPVQPIKRQRDLFQDYGQHSRATRREAFKAKRQPLIERVISQLRLLGKHGATLWELHLLLDVPYQSVGRPCVDLKNDRSIFETGERRKTATGSWASVMVHSDFAGTEAKS